MATSAGATIVTYEFSGLTSMAMGGVAANTAFTGSFTYDTGVAAQSTAYNGGTQNIFDNAYSALTLTIGGNTVSSTVPGDLALYDSVNPPHSIPVGDSLYTFQPLSGGGPLASTGSFAGLTPNYIYLGFVDVGGTVFSSGGSLPGNLNLADFDSAFIGINYGPFGAGNTTTISSLRTLQLTAAVPEPESYALMLAGLAMISLAARRRRA
ncbi:MAG: PEP-CTERM sorting domain-containing protein [Pseudomonadota bacterium]